MSKIWFTSDTHYHHKNIVRGTSEWIDSRNEGNGQSTRDFNTLEEHDNAIVNGMNKYVKENDTLWHLGDWSFGGIEQIWEFRRRLFCKNIHLVLGNHDHHIENAKILPNCKYSNNEFFTILDAIEPAQKGFEVGAQGLFNSVQHVYNGKSFFLSHYAHRVWDKSHHGRIHLYGHSHDSLDNKGEYWGKSMDVGMDSAFRIFGEYRPFSYEEIIEIMKERETKIIDHHNQNTN